MGVEQGVVQAAGVSEMMKELTGYISDKVIKGKSEVNEDTPLVSSGLVDSFAMIDIFLELQRIAGRKVPVRRAPPRGEVASNGTGPRSARRSRIVRASS